ncbi:hypothetical protein OB03_01690 [Brevundimonas sp. GN22]
MKTAHIGAAGELLVQYRLLKHGIDSAAMTIDDGIDLVAYSPRLRDAVTIQVKTINQPKPGGGKGKLANNWRLRESSPATLVALCDLSTDRTWIFRHEEFVKEAQQHSKGTAHLYFYVDRTARVPSQSMEAHFDRYLIERRIDELFGSPEPAMPNEI